MDERWNLLPPIFQRIAPIPDMQKPKENLVNQLYQSMLGHLAINIVPQKQLLSIITWNVRTLNKYKIQALVQKVFILKPTFVWVIDANSTLFLAGYTDISLKNDNHHDILFEYG